MGWDEVAAYKRKEFGIEDDYADIGEEARVQVPTSQSQAAKSTFQPSSGSGVGGNMTQAGMMGLGAAKGSSLAAASPYLLAGGAALGVLSANERRKQEQAQAQANAENQKRANMQSSLQGMAALYGRMKL